MDYKSRRLINVLGFFFVLSLAGVVDFCVLHGRRQELLSSYVAIVLGLLHILNGPNRAGIVLHTHI